ncbi:hypothetical protein PspLS_07570 [Pyricularia sp. CBS 133598]|nr:hypothetical protein PspLS_07570 [Pyricularia sp. CBS 133598]
MCIKSLPSQNIQRCEAWKAEARRAEGGCFVCRSERKVCDLQVVVDRSAQEASDRRVDQHCNDLLSGAPVKAKEAERANQARRDLLNRQRQRQQQQQQRPAAPSTRPARPPPAQRPGHVGTQQQPQVRPTTNGNSNSSSSSTSSSGRAVGQQRIAIPMSKYSTIANARPSPMPRVSPPPLPTAPTRHRPTRERRATQHPTAVARIVSQVEASDLSTFEPSPVSPAPNVKVRYGKSYFDID